MTHLASMVPALREDAPVLAGILTVLILSLML